MCLLTAGWSVPGETQGLLLAYVSHLKTISLDPKNETRPLKIGYPLITVLGGPVLLVTWESGETAVWPVSSTDSSANYPGGKRTRTGFGVEGQIWSYRVAIQDWSRTPCYAESLSL